MHQRQIIREAVYAALFEKTSVGSKVAKNRQRPYRNRELPAIDIVNVDDDVDPESWNSAPKELAHTYVLGILVRVSVTDAVDDVMDSLAKEIEPLMHADPYFDGAAGGRGSMLKGTTFDFDTEGEYDIGLMTLRYDFEYQTHAPEKPSGMDDFNTAHATHKQGADQSDDDDAEDNIILDP